MTRTEYREAVQEYIEGLPSLGKSPDTIRSYSTTLRRFGDYLDRTEQEPSKMTIEKWRIEQAKQSRPSVIILRLRILNKFFGWCVTMGKLDENPITRDAYPKPEQIEYNLLDTLEIDTLLRAPAPHEMHVKNARRNRAIVVTLLQSGLRSQELLALRESDLDFENSVILVQHGKGDKKRFAPFPNLAQEAVRAYLNSGERPLKAKATDYLFGHLRDQNGRQVWGKMQYRTLYALIKEYSAKAAGHRVSPHALRHAFASKCDDAGIGLRTIQKALGHSSITTTEKIYVAILDKHKAATQIAEVFNSSAK